MEEDEWKICSGAPSREDASLSNYMYWIGISIRGVSDVRTAMKFGKRRKPNPPKYSMGKLKMAPMDGT